MSNHQVQTRRPTIAHLIRRCSVLVILGWLAVVVGLNLGIPSLEQVQAEHAVSQNPTDAPSFRAAERISQAFQAESSDNSSPGTSGANSNNPGAGSGNKAAVNSGDIAPAMIVLEGQQPLDDAAHKYYDNLIRQFRSDTQHVQHIQDFWGDPLTRDAAQSGDGKAAFVQLSLKGKPGDTVANESVQAVAHIVANTPAPRE